MMNPFWNMSSSSVRKKPDEEKVSGDQKISPPRVSSAKKQLPSIPKNAVPITKPISPAPAAQATNGTHASYGPFYLEYSLLAEFTLMVKQKLPGVYVQPSYRSALMWFGVIFIRHGLYQDGVFKFTVYIPDNYPDGECPRLVFDIPVFHPLVDPISGELDVKRAFAKWRRNHNHIWQVLMYARRIFYKIDTIAPLNPEAAVLYEEDVPLFKSKVVDSVKLCNSHLFDQPKMEDPYAITFSPWNPALHDEAREKMLAQKVGSELSPSDLLHLNVGGWAFSLPASALARSGDSVLWRDVSCFPPTDDRRLFLDRDGSVFRLVHCFLITSQLSTSCMSELDVLCEQTRVLRLQPMIEVCPLF